MPARVFMSSGDMLADRRFDFARDLQLRGDLAAAADLFAQAAELAPGFAAAWFALGEVRERLGEREAAIAAFRHAQMTDSGDHNGAGLRLMRLGAAELASMPPTYVSALFNQYAPKFEASLVDELGYRGPHLLFKSVLAARAHGTKQCPNQVRIVVRENGQAIAGSAASLTAWALNSGVNVLHVFAIGGLLGSSLRF